MKKLHNFLIKAFSMCLAFILVFPTNLFAMGLDNTKYYTATASVMGLATNDDSGKENTDQTLLASDVTSTDTGKYIIEKSAKLSKTTGKVDFMIKVFAKEKSYEDTLTASFAISENTDLKDLKVERVSRIDKTEEEIKYQEQKPSILQASHAFETLGVTTEKADLVYYLSAQLTDEALADIEDKSPTMALNFNIGADTQESYGLSIEKMEEVGEAGQEPSQILKEDQINQIKAIYKEKTSSLLGEKPAEITWTDYILPTEKTIYDIKLDQDQELFQVKIDFYQASEKGYVIKDEYSKTMESAQSLNLQIPQDQIARIEVRTKVTGNPKSFTYNNKEIPNPNFIDETENDKENKKETSEEDADPLPASSLKNETGANSSNDIISEDKDQDFSTNPSQEESQSAIALNKEAYLVKAENKEAVKQIAKVLEAYNNGESDFDQIKASLESIAKENNLGVSQTEEIITALISGLNEEKYKLATINPADLTVDIKEANDQTKLADDEIKGLIKEEFAKKNSGQITEEELEHSLEQIRDENNIDKETFFNILADLYKNDSIETKNLEEESIDTEKSKEEVLAEKLAEENLSTEDFIKFLQSYAKSYGLEESELQTILTENKDEVEKLIGDFTIDEIVAAAYHEGLNPQILAADENANAPSIDFSNEKFMTELEYKTVTLSDENNIGILKEIVKKFDPVSSDQHTDQQITDAYVGWRINLPGSDPTGWDLQELKSDKYKFHNLGISLYAPDDQGLRNYYVRITEAGSGRVISSGYMKQNGSHLTYGTDILKANLPSDGINIDVVAEAPVKRQSYTIGLRVTPDKNYITSLANQFKDKYEVLKQKYPFLIKWKDTSQADAYNNGLNLVDTRMVYLEPESLQERTPYTPYISKEYTDNNMDTDTGIGKNTFTMFGNLDDDGKLKWTISETMTLEKLYGYEANEIGNSAYSVSGYGNPEVEILEPSGSGYVVKVGPTQMSQDQLKNNLLNAVPGTIVNYTYTKKVDNPGEDQTVTIDHFGSQEVSVKLKEVFDGENDPSLESYDNSKLDQQPNGPGYEVALREPDFMWAFKPLEPNKSPRNQDKGINLNGVLAYCINMGKKYPTRSNGFNKTMTKVQLGTNDGNKITEKLNNPRLTGTPSTPENVMENVRKVFWYADQMQKEYNFDTQTLYRIVQYNIFYYTSTDAEQYAYQFGQNMLPGAMRSYAEELKNRVAAGKGWDQVSEDQVHVYMYEHSDKSRQTVIAGDVHAKDKAKVGRLEVLKFDAKGGKTKPLYGAIFELQDSDGNLIKRATTDDKGIARFEDIPVGNGYKLIEVKAPAGYTKDSTIRTINITDIKTTKQAVRVDVPNSKPKIELTKVDEKYKPIDGVSFILRRNGIDVANSTVVSKNGGEFGWYDGLTPGSYEVVEVDLPTGYENYSDNKGKVVYRFKIDANNQIVETSKENLTNENKISNVIVNKKNEPKKGQIEFTKQDSTTKDALEGAEFVLEYRKPGFTTYKTLDYTKKTTDSNGKISWKDLEAGDYRVIETKAPSKNYQTDINLGEKATFTVSSDGKTHTITNVNPSSKVITNETKPEEGEGSFEFEKIDEDTKEKLQGVEFTLESVGTVSDGKKEFVYKTSKTSDENGKIKFYKLLPGTYKLRETKPLAGYEANKNEWTVIVTKDRTTGAYTTKVLDSEGNDLTTSNSQFEIGPDKGLAYIGNYLGTVRANVEETDQQDVLDLNLSITPESEPYTSSNPVNIYYIYDSEESKQMIENLAENIDIKDKTVLKYGIKVSQDTVIDNDSRFTNQFYEIEKFINRYNTQNNIVVSAFTKSYNNIGLSDIRTMTEGRNNLALRGIPIFAYHKEAVTDPDFIDAVYNRNIYHFEDNYNPKIFDELKEVVDYINAGKSKLAGETIEFTTTSPVEVINGTTPNSHYINGLFLKANVSNNITLKIKVSDLNSLNDGSLLNDYLSLKATKNGTDLSSVIPDIKINKSGSSSSTPGSTGGSTGTGTSTGPAIIRQPITNNKKEPKPAKLTIKKVDGLSNEALDGAEFGLYESEADANSKTVDPIQTVTTDENGYAVFDSDKITENTKYYLKETKAPEGYMITDGGITEVSSSASADNKINAEIKNYKNNAKIDLYKKDDDDKYLEGVKFELKKTKSGTSQDGLMKVGETQVLTTDSYGHISYPLDVDSEYELIELRTLDGYQLNKNKATIKVDKEGNVTVDGGKLLTVEKGKEIVLKTETKETPLGAWKSGQTAYTNPSQAYPSYMNTLDYAEYNPDTKEVTHYIMLKPDEDIGGKTDRATTLTLSSANAKIKSVSLYDAYSGDTKASYKKAMQDKSVSLSGNTANAQNDNRNLYIKMGGDGKVTVRSSMTDLSTTSAYIKFPYDTGKKKGRFDANWAMLVKVVASVEDTKKVSSMSFNWTTDEAGQLSTSSSQTIPALIEDEEIPGKTIKESPTLTAINEKKPEKPSINFVKKDFASGENLYGAQFVLYKVDGILASEKEVENSLTSSDAGGKFGFDNLGDGSYKVYETVSPDGYPYLAKKKEVAKFEVKGGKLTTNPVNKIIEETGEYVVYNKANEIKFRKVGEGNEKLSSGKFEIRKVSNELITEKITSKDGTTQTVVKSKPSELVASTQDTTPNENGELVWSIKEPGRFQVVETQAPDGYKDVGSGLVVAEFTVAKETLEITNILVGDKFYSDTKEFPEGGFVNIENKKQGESSFELTKTDMGEEPTRLENAKFLLQDKSTGTYIKADGSQSNELGKAIETTNTSGKISYNNLSNGTYILREYEAPDGYIKSKNIWEVIVQGDNTSITLVGESDVGDSDREESVINGSNLTVKNRGNKITFEKVDKDNPDKKLQGAEFIVYREQDYTNWEGNTGYSRYEDASGKDTFTSNKDGKIVLENLKMGHYKVYEIKAPDGYYVEDDLADDSNRDMLGLPADAKYVANFYVDINGYIKADEKEEGTTTELTKVIKNTANKAKFRLLKVDNNNKALRSAQFTLTEDGLIGNEGYKYVGTTTSDGAIEFANLKLGKSYTLKETKAPAGYIATDQEWKVEVDQAGIVSITAKIGSSDDSIISEDINNLTEENKEKLNANGYLILNATDDNDTTIKVLNRKPSMPQTGGTGTKIAFALIGTAVMITAIAYFGMLTSNKNRRRSRR